MRSPLLPLLLRQRFAGQGIKEFPERWVEDQLDAEGNEVIFINDLLGHIADTDPPTDLFTNGEKRDQTWLDEIDMPG